MSGCVLHQVRSDPDRRSDPRADVQVPRQRRRPGGRRLGPVEEEGQARRRQGRPRQDVRLQRPPGPSEPFLFLLCGRLVPGFYRVLLAFS